MEYTLEIIVFYILLIDSLGANLISWTGNRKWYARTFAPLSKHFPITRGWSSYYLILVIWLGYIMTIHGVILF